MMRIHITQWLIVIRQQIPQNNSKLIQAKLAALQYTRGIPVWPGTLARLSLLLPVAEAVGMFRT